MTGTITRIKNHDGYFFIRTPAGVDYFATAGRCHSKFTSLHVGDKVIFDVNESSARPQARNIMILLEFLETRHEQTL